jgi:hypothetical protein
MLSSLELTRLFFCDLKSFNSTNFRTIEKATLDRDDATVHKAFSSVVTRYFIFAERHPEISPEEKRILYFKLKIDMIARYFSEYPDVNLDLLKPFQLELKQHVRESKGGDLIDESGMSTAI